MTNAKRKYERIMREVRAMEKRATVSASIVLDQNGAHVATVRIWRSDKSGAVRACVANWRQPKPQDRTNWTPWAFGLATGYGYDKATAALSGVIIDGYTLKDDGQAWYNQLSDAGFRVIAAI